MKVKTTKRYHCPECGSTSSTRAEAVMELGTEEYHIGFQKRRQGGTWCTVKTYDNRKEGGE